MSSGGATGKSHKWEAWPEHGRSCKIPEIARIEAYRLKELDGNQCQCHGIYR